MFTTVHMSQLLDHDHVVSLLPLPVESSDTGEATGYNSKFYIDQCQLVAKVATFPELEVHSEAITPVEMAILRRCYRAELLGV